MQYKNGYFQPLNTNLDKLFYCNKKIEMIQAVSGTIAEAFDLVHVHTPSFTGFIDSSYSSHDIYKCNNASTYFYCP